MADNNFNPNDYKWLLNYEETYNQYEDIPEGWREAFGEMLIKDIDEVVKRDNIEVGGDFGFRVMEIKEKWGELRMYFFNSTDEIERIVTNYSMLSKNICIGCGKPDVPWTTGYIIPVCEKCFRKWWNSDYRKAIADQGSYMMPDTYVTRRTNKDGIKETIHDVSDLTKKIRARWKTRKEEIE